MAKPYIITGLDIGTSSIKALAGLKNPDSPILEVVGQVSESVLGIRKGVVIDVEEVSEGINRILTQLQEKTSQKIDEVHVNINGSHVLVTPSHGSVVVSRADQRISQEDVERVLQSAQALSLPLNKEILDIFPREFLVDGEGGIKKPAGMKGMRLEAEILALCVFSPYLKNLTNAVLDAGFHVANIVASPFASSRSVLTSRQKELGVCLADIGAGTTGLAVYQEGSLVHAAILPVGSSHITNDIAIGLKTDINIAERIKKELGICGSIVNKKGGQEIRIELPQEPPLVFSRNALANIIDSRVTEIFELIAKELRKLPSSCLLPAGVVFTGGGSKLSGLLDFAKKELKLPVSLGSPRVQVDAKQGQEQAEWSGLDQGASEWAGACGLVLFGEDWKQEESEDLLFSPKGVLGKIKKMFKIFIP